MVKMTKFKLPRITKSARKRIQEIVRWEDDSALSDIPIAGKRNMIRYDLERFNSCGGMEAAMVESEGGDWVKYDDIADADRAVVALKAVEAIFADLRDRRLLKWIFSSAGSFCNIGRFDNGEELCGLDLDVQAEIKAAWQVIIAGTISQVSQN